MSPPTLQGDHTLTPPAPAPADAAHYEARRQRRARFIRAAASGLAVRAVNIVAQVISLGVAVRYLGRERYGMWAAVSTFVAWFAMANLGLGHGLTARLCAALGRDDRDAAHRYINSALAVICLTAGAMLAVVLAVGPLVPWARVFNVVAPEAVAEARDVVMVASVMTILILPLGLATSVLTGYQRLDVANVQTLVSSIGSLALLLVAVYCNASMPVLAAALILAPLAAAGIQFAWAMRHGLIRISAKAVNWSDAGSLLSLGLGFLCMQISGIIVFEAGAIIIAQRFGAGEVTPYAVTTRMVMIILSFLGPVLGSLVPAYGEAFHRGDVEWVRRTFWRSFRLVIATWLPTAIVLLLFGPWIIRVWAGPDAVPGRLLLSAMLAYALAMALGFVVSYPLNGIGKVRSQVIGGGLMALLHVPLVLLLAGRAGVASVAISQALLMFLIALPLAFAEFLSLVRHPSREPQGRAH